MSLLPLQAGKTLAGGHIQGGNVEVIEGMLHSHGAQVWGWATVLYAAHRKQRCAKKRRVNKRLPFGPQP